MRNVKNEIYKKRICLLLMLIVCGILSQGYAVFAATRSLNVDTPTQEQIRQYVEEHTGNSAANTIYSTEPVTEDPYSAGALSDATLQSALDALNEIRYIAGIFDGVVLDSTYTAKCQAGTLVNCVNGVLSHTPSKPSDMDDDLYQLGYAGMSSSNIAWGYTSLVSAVQHGWMADEDTGNIDRLGHRRWCLNPEMGRTGFGHTGSFTAMYSFDSSHTVSQATTVVWPAQNMPTDYFDASYPWSISSDTAFSNDVKIVLTYVDGDSDASNDKKWEFSSAFADGYFNYDKQGYGQRYCLIFRPNDITMYYDNDKFEVQVIENDTVTLEYTVNFFDLKPIPEDVTLKLAKTYGSMELIDDGYYWSATTITVSDASIDIKKKMKIYSSDDSIAQAMIGTPSNGRATVFIKTNKDGVAQLTFQLAKNIKAVYKVTVGDGGGHVHNNIEISVKKATCEQTGLRTLECEMCGVPSTEVIEVIDHDYDEGVITKEPTCSNVGEKMLTCNMCGGTTTEAVATVDHVYETTYTIDKTPSCKEEGSKSYHCRWYEECGLTKGTTAIDKTDDHSYDEGIVTTEPTCTTVGEKTFTCSICDGTTTEEMDVVSHKYKTSYTVDKEPSCKEEGSKSYHCTWYSVCGEVSGVTAISKTDDHSYDDGVVTKDSTCTIVGDRTLTCTICEGTKIVDEPTVAHEYDTTYTVDQEPSCKEEGSKSYHCIWYAECKVSKGAVAIEKTDDHIYDDGVVTTEPTCSTEGVKTFTCSVCKGTRMESVDEVSHSYEDEFTIDEEATCVAEGSESRHCAWYEICGQFVDETVIEINDNHSFNEGEVTTSPSCTKEGIRTFTCVLCTHTKTETEPMIEHSYDEGVMTKAPTCTVEGERMLTCEECTGTKVISIEKTAHEYDTKFTVDQEPTCTINGSKSRHCKDCGDKTDISTIFTDGHVAGDWIIDKEATYTEAGSKHKECTVCHAVIESESIARLEQQPVVTPNEGEISDQNTEQDVDPNVGEYIDPDSYEELEEDENWEDDEIMVSGGSSYYIVRYDDDGDVTVAYAGPKDLSVKELVIPSAIAMDGEVYRVTAIRDNAFAKCKKLKTVKMSKYITKIGKNAFSGCSKLTKVNLSSNLTTIGSGAFAKCTSLKSIVIPKSVKKIGSKAFYNCKKLKKITIKTTSLKSSAVGNKAFSGIEKKATVKVPKKKVVTYKTLLKKKGLPKKATVRRG